MPQRARLKWCSPEEIANAAAAEAKVLDTAAKRPSRLVKKFGAEAVEAAAHTEVFKGAEQLAQEGVERFAAAQAKATEDAAAALKKAFEQGGKKVEQQALHAAEQAIQKARAVGASEHVAAQAAQDAANKVMDDAAAKEVKRVAQKFGARTVEHAAATLEQAGQKTAAEVAQEAIDAADAARRADLLKNIDAMEREALEYTERMAREGTFQQQDAFQDLIKKARKAWERNQPFGEIPSAIGELTPAQQEALQRAINDANTNAEWAAQRKSGSASAATQVDEQLQNAKKIADQLKFELSDEVYELGKSLHDFSICQKGQLKRHCSWPFKEKSYFNTKAWQGWGCTRTTCHIGCSREGS